MTVRRPFSPKGGSEKHAVESNRHHNVPLYASIGEIIDNSIEWNATTIHILVKWKQDEPNEPEQMVFIDDGDGMSAGKLSDSLVTGFHEEADNKDKQIGRFGVGCTYAFLANCTRADVYSKLKDGPWHHSMFDLEAQELDDPSVDYPPDAQPMNPPSNIDKYWKGLKSGTITIWSNFDQGHVETNRDEVPFWISRAYRKFIGEEIVVCNKVGREWEAAVEKNPEKLVITYNDEMLRAYDPLYAIPYRKGDKGGTLYKPIVIQYPKTDGSGRSPIRVMFGLSPESWRPLTGASANDPVNTKERHIRGAGAGIPSVSESGKWSIMRNRREVSWISDGRLHGRQRDVDRWWGMEIQYDAALDDVFNVQNVKYQVGISGALRKKLKDEIKSTIDQLRSNIEDVFEKSKKKKDADDRKKESGGERGPDIIVPGDLDDVTDTAEAPDQFLKKVIKNAAERKEILETLSERKFVEKEDWEKRVPKDTNLLFEYHAQGGEVLMMRYANHPWFRSMVSAEKALMQRVKHDDLDVEKLEDIYHEMRVLWDILFQTLVISLATANPNETQQRIIDKIISRWGQLAMDKSEGRLDIISRL